MPFLDRRLQAWTGKQLRHCVVLFFWSFWIIYCALFTLENKSSAHALGCASCVASFMIIDEQLK